MTSTSTVGFPRLSSTSRAWMRVMVSDVVMVWRQVFNLPARRQVEKLATTPSYKNLLDPCLPLDPLRFILLPDSSTTIDYGDKPWLLTKRFVSPSSASALGPSSSRFTKSILMPKYLRFAAGQ